MALPFTFSDLFYRQPQAKPFKAPNGAFYVVAPVVGAVTDIKVLKATDPSASWSEQDAANRPVAASDHYALNAVLSASVIHIVHASIGTPGTLLYSTFNTATDQWAIIAETVTSYDTTTPALGIGLRGDGDVLVTYQGATESVMGTAYSRVYIARREGGAWTANIRVDNLGKSETHLIVPHGIMADQTNSRFHVTYMVGATGGELRYSTYLSNNTFGHRHTLADSTAGLNDREINKADAVAFTDGANRKVRFLYSDASDILRTIGFNDADNPGTPTISAAINDSSTVQNASLSVDETTQHVLFRRTDNLTIIRHDQTGAGNDTWGTDTNELSTSGTIEVYSANVYQRGSNIVLAYLYTQAGVEKYNERVLRSAPIERTTAFNGSGALASIAAFAGAIAIAAAGALATTATLTIPATTAFNGSGSLTSVARLVATTASNAAAAMTSAARFVATTAYNGSGTFTTAARLLATTAYNGAGTFDTAAVVKLMRTTEFSAAGTLTSAARFAATTAYSGVGTMTSNFARANFQAANGDFYEDRRFAKVGIRRRRA